MNRVFLIGNISTDITLRYTQSNIAVASFNLAVDRPRKQDGTQETDFINIVVWGKQAENCHKYTSKGSQIAIEGRIQIRTYETEDGQKRYVTEVVAENVQFLNTKKQDTVNNASSTTETLNQTQSQTDVFEDFGKQVSLDEYPTNEDDLPF